MRVPVGDPPTGVNAPRGLHRWRTSADASTTYRGDKVRWALDPRRHHVSGDGHGDSLWGSWKDLIKVS